MNEYGSRSRETLDAVAKATAAASAAYRQYGRDSTEGITAAQAADAAEDRAIEDGWHAADLLRATRTQQ